MIGVFGIVVPGEVVGVRVIIVVEVGVMITIGLVVLVIVIPPVEVGVRVTPGEVVGVITGGLDVGVGVTAGGV